MQESVTHKIYKRNHKKRASAVIFLVVFFLIIFFISAILIVSKRSSLCFDARRFYIVYADKNKNEDLLLNIKEQVKKQGGAGVFVEKDLEFFVAVGVYGDKSDANEIANDISNVFENAGVVELSCKGLSNEQRNLIKQHESYFHLFEKIYDFLNAYESCCFQFVKGEISEGKFFSQLLADKLEFEKLIELCNANANEKLSQIVLSANKMVGLFENLFAKFYSSSDKESLCFELFVNFVLTYKDLCDNLQ